MILTVLILGIIVLIGIIVFLVMSIYETCLDIRDHKKEEMPTIKIILDKENKNDNAINA